MLQVNLDKQHDILHLYFDVPIPSVCENNKDLNLLLAKLRDIAQAEFAHNKDGLTGVSVPLSRWISFVEGVVEADSLFFQKNIIADLLKEDMSEQDDGLQVNFHQNHFDTPLRYWNFILNQDNFVDYFFNRINWFIGPKNSIVTPFPLHVDIESANTCNMDCPMCYRKSIKEIGQIDYKLFQKVIDECADNNVYSVRLSWRGETLTHPQIKDLIAYATRKIKNVSFLTNAFYLDEEMADCFIDNGVSYIAVSFDGLGETYEAIRHPAKFEENYRRLEMLLNRREKKNCKLPQVRLCTIWPAISDDPDAYYQTMKDVSDYIVCNPYINFAVPMKIKEDFICQYPWERIMVAFNGKTQCCTGWNADDIILGNIKDKTIKDMWNSDLMNKIRETHAKGRRMDLNSCANCRHGSKGDPNISIEEILERRY